MNKIVMIMTIRNFSSLALYYFRYFYVISFIFFGMIVTSCHHKTKSQFTKLEKKVLPTFELPPGFKIELIAAEPLVSDPVDMTIDAEGHMYVVEMHGYPLNVRGVDDVVMLSDTDRNGIMDKRTVFADSLVLPDGIMPWKNGVIVTAPPNVFYLEDTTGDGKADIKKLLLTGFALANPQHNVNHPRYGLDNWIYLSHQFAVGGIKYPKKFGNRGSEIYFPAQPDSPRLDQNADGRIVRFRPDSHQLEEMSCFSQFGQTWDTWGHHFLVTNSDHIYQSVIANRYLKRNPNLLVSKARQDLSDHGNASKVYPITKNPEYQLLTNIGVITSACGLTYYLGNAFPEKYNNNVTFVCEPVSNLIHVDRIKPKGATFIASRILDYKAFLASTDSWFRPVDLYIGPDGALYVLDYYREIIEHPEWMAKDVIKSGKLYNGSKKGRIYRISAKDGPLAKWTKGLHLRETTDKQLVEKLADKNIWWRRTAQRLLVERNSNQAVPALIKMAGNTESSLGRLHALWTLQGMNKLTSDIIEQALRDSVRGVRENAVKLAELHMDTDPELVSSLLKIRNDPDPKVRFQLLLTLGFINTPKANKVRQQLLFKDINDQWFLDAALSAPSSHAIGLLEATLSKFNPDLPGYTSLVHRLSTIIGASQDTKVIQKYIQRSLTTIPDGNDKWQAPLITGIAQGLKARRALPSGLGAEQDILVQACLNDSSLAIRKGALNILQVIGLSENNGHIHAAMQKANQIASNDNFHEGKRVVAVNFLTLNNPKRHMLLFKRLISSIEPVQIQLAALHSLEAIHGLDGSKYVLQHWASLSPKMRRTAIDLFMSNPERIKLLLDAVESGKVIGSDISQIQRNRLMNLKNKKLKKRTRTLFTNKNENREAVIQQYKVALKMSGDSKRGKLVFQRNCAICHQIRGKMGRAFGPDLGTVQAWDPETILVNILDPNKSISSGYEMWIVKLNNGNLEQGIISTQTPNAITFKSENGQEVTILRNDIKSWKPLETSVMPIGFENKINKQQIADLIAFIKHEK